MGAGFGELDAEDATAFSATAGVPLNEAGIPAVSDERCLVRANTLIPDVRGRDCGDCGGGISPAWCIRVPWPGEDESEPALKGWKGTEGLPAISMPSNDLSDALEVCIGLVRGNEPRGGELVSEPIVLAARSADIGLEPKGGASP